MIYRAGGPIITDIGILLIPSANTTGLLSMTVESVGACLFSVGSHDKLLDLYEH